MNQHFNITKKAYISFLSQCIQLEQEEEKKQYHALSKNLNHQDKIKTGVLLKGLQCIRKYFAAGDQQELEFEYHSPIGRSSKFRVGMACTLSSPDDESSAKATVSFLRSKTIKVLLHSDTDIDWVRAERGKYNLETIYDNRPYQVMLNAIRGLEETNRIELNELIYLCAGLDIQETSLATSSTLDSFQIHSLNKSQNAAITKCLNSPFVSLVHGPPGTGKTTTIIELVRALRIRQQKVLVTASSNNAVDLVAEGLLHRQVEVLRIGNIARISDPLIESTLNEKIKNHKDWTRIKQIKIEAEEARKAAGKWKRSFGEDERRQRKMMYQEYKELKKWSKDLEHKITTDIIDRAPVVATTLIGASHHSITDIIYDYVIIDEASQALEPECWNVILKAKKIILVGDHKQLPPTIKSMKAKQAGLEQTLLDKLMKYASLSSFLDTQYRMHPSILGFPNTQFYNDKLQSARDPKSYSLQSIPSLLHIDTCGCGFEEKMNKHTRSYYNDGEFFILREFIYRHFEELKNTSIGIMSPYAEQVRYLRTQFQKDEKLAALQTDIDSIDGFQGRERDVIFLLFTRSNDRSEIGFLKDKRRLNVALTRAKDNLITIGDSATLASDHSYVKLINHMEEQNSYASAYEYMY